MDNTQWDRALLACMTFPSSLDTGDEEELLAAALRFVYRYTNTKGKQSWRARNPETKRYVYASGDEGRQRLARLVVEWRGEQVLDPTPDRRLTPRKRKEARPC